MGFYFGEKVEMEVNVARFKCIHPNCSERMENDYSVQTIYEHISQHLFQDTGERDHFNMRCSCGSKFNFSLLPYATSHLDQNKHELNKHQIICSPITVSDIDASKKILAYQKRFIEFHRYITEREVCPNLGVFPKKNINTALHQVISTMEVFQIAPDQNHNSSSQNDNRAQEIMDIARTPIYRHYPSPPAKPSAYKSPDQHGRKSHGSYSGRRSPERNRDRRSSEGRRDRRSPSPYSSHRGRSHRGSFGRDHDRGRSFSRECSRFGNNQGRPYNDRGRGRGRGRGSYEYDNRFSARNSIVNRTHGGFYGGNDGPDDRLTDSRKRSRGGLSPRSSDDDSQKGEPDTRRPGNPSADIQNGNSTGGATGVYSQFCINRGKVKSNEVATKALRDGTSPRSSDED